MPGAGGHPVGREGDVDGLVEEHPRVVLGLEHRLPLGDGLVHRTAGLAHALARLLARLRGQGADLAVGERQRGAVAGVVDPRLLERVEVGGGGDGGQGRFARGVDLLGLQGADLHGVVVGVGSGHPQSLGTCGVLPRTGSVSSYREAVPGRLVGQLLRFAWLEAQSCLFAVALFAGLLVAYVVPLPVARYDALLAWCVVITLVFWALGLETWREVLVIAGFHLVGLGLEVFKVHVGSWSYPGDAVTVVWGVPLFSGFMYAAVGSYVCQAWRRFDLRVSGFDALPTTLVAVAVYANFFTHHWTVDLRVPIAVVGVVVLRRAWVGFTVGRARYRMPLALSFVLIGLFLWLAENLATYLGAWKYPGQLEVWEVVHTAKIGSWALLVTMSFVLVAAVKRWEGELYSVVHQPQLRPGTRSRTPV